MLRPSADALAFDFGVTPLVKATAYGRGSLLRKLSGTSLFRRIEIMILKSRLFHSVVACAALALLTCTSQ
jgi:hypothetical protein